MNSDSKHPATAEGSGPDAQQALHRVLMVHNRYRQTGGEDRAFEAQGSLLEQRGHAVLRYEADNASIRPGSGPRVAAAGLWNQSVYRDICRIIDRHRPAIMHVHNTFPLISPSVYFAARSRRLPVVQTLHNFRIWCVNSYFFREGRICEDCRGKKSAWRGVVHACYHDGRLPSAAAAAISTAHHAAGTWSRVVDLYIALSKFSREKYITAGLPADRILVRPNFVFPDPGPGPGTGGFVLYAGRLSPEKGADTLAAAWARTVRLPLLLAGEGPLGAQFDSLKGCKRLGVVPRETTLELMGQAAAIVLPSRSYEHCPMVVLEAMAKGTPAIVSDAGGSAEMILAGRTGLVFAAGDPQDLAGKIRELLEDPAALKSRRAEVRKQYLVRFSADPGYLGLIDAYRRALTFSSDRRT